MGGSSVGLGQLCAGVVTQGAERRAQPMYTLRVWGDLPMWGCPGATEGGIAMTKTDAGFVHGGAEGSYRAEGPMGLAGGRLRPCG